MIAWLIRLVSRLAEMRARAALRTLAVNVHAKCPACGHWNGKIKAIVAQGDAGAQETFIEHQCQVCSAKFYEPTILKAEKWLASRPGGLMKIPPPINEEKPFSPGK